MGDRALAVNQQELPRREEQVISPLENARPEKDKRHIHRGQQKKRQRHIPVALHEREQEVAEDIRREYREKLRVDDIVLSKETDLQAAVEAVKDKEHGAVETGHEPVAPAPERHGNHAVVVMCPEQVVEPDLDKEYHRCRAELNEALIAFHLFHTVTPPLSRPQEAPREPGLRPGH